MSKQLWVRTENSSPVRVAGPRGAAARLRELGATGRDAGVGQGSDLHRFWVERYDVNVTGRIFHVWMYWTRGRSRAPLPLSDADTADVQRALRALNNPASAPEFLYIRAGSSDVATRVRVMSEAARRARERGFTSHVVLTRTTTSAHKYEVLPYDVAFMPLWLYFGDERGEAVRALTDGERDLFETELRYINQFPPTTEDRLNNNIEAVVAALRGLAAPREGGMAEVKRRCFEFRHSGSDKFWTIEWGDNTVLTTYGKIGSNGATQVKTFPSASRTAEHVAKIIREKTGKGYSEVAAGKWPGAPASQVLQLSGPVAAASPPPPPPPAPRPTGEPEEGDRNIDI